MQPASPLPNLAEPEHAWTEFTAHGHTSLNIDPLVQRSWRRTAPRLNPRGAPQWSYLSDQVLPSARRQHAALLALAVVVAMLFAMS